MGAALLRPRKMGSQGARCVHSRASAGKVLTLARGVALWGGAARVIASVGGPLRGEAAPCRVPAELPGRCCRGGHVLE